MGIVSVIDDDTNDTADAADSTDAEGTRHVAALVIGSSLPIPLTETVVAVVAAVVAANADNSIVFVVLVVGIIGAALALALALVDDIVVRNFAREPVQHTNMENTTTAGKQTDRQLLLD